jgi:predicted NAD/FAD-binding protein
VQKLAIIGGGISGVSLAYLVQQQFDVTLFESQDYLGGNNCSTEVEDGHKVPMGVIIYPSRGLFEHTLSFADEFGLESKPAQLPHIFCSNREIRFRSASGSGHFCTWIATTRRLTTSSPKTGCRASASRTCWRRSQRYTCRCPTPRSSSCR